MTVVPAALRPPSSFLDFDPMSLARSRWQSGTTISVCLPARNEAATIGAIVRAIRRDLVETSGLVDEVVVMDDGSTDHTADEAAAAGARVESVTAVLPELPAGSGKGNVMWRSLWATRGDLICWVDADVRGFDPRLVVGMIGPLLSNEDVDLVKGFFRRPAEGLPHGGGRVTELVARPLISMLFPRLAEVVQPLAGFTAGRRAVLEAVPFFEGWGVEFGLLVDVAERVGLDRLAQVDLGSIEHDRGTLRKLAPQAMAVLAVALRRAGMDHSTDPICHLLAFDEGHVPDLQEVSVAERPPINSVAEYRARAAAAMTA